MRRLGTAAQILVRRREASCGTEMTATRKTPTLRAIADPLVSTWAIPESGCGLQALVSGHGTSSSRHRTPSEGRAGRGSAGLGGLAGRQGWLERIDNAAAP